MNELHTPKSQSEPIPFTLHSANSATSFSLLEHALSEPGPTVESAVDDPHVRPPPRRLLHERSLGVSVSLRRAGLLSRNTTSSAPPLILSPHCAHVAPHSPNDIRASTVQLSNMTLDMPIHSDTEPMSEFQPSGFIFPTSPPMASHDQLHDPQADISDSMNSSMMTVSSSSSVSAPSHMQASGLTLLRPASLPSLTAPVSTPAPLHDDVDCPTPVPSPRVTSVQLSDDTQFSVVPLSSTERTPLISLAAPRFANGTRRVTFEDDEDRTSSNGHPEYDLIGGKGRAPMPSRVVQALQHVAKDALKSIPAVLLGLLLNVLDGVSYGILIFPTAEPYISLGLSSAGVSMFFVSCLAAQLVFSAGGSGFKGANGSMMIEVVPFFHILSSTIASEIGLLPGNERAIAATTLASYALSSILTGTTFLLLGSLKLGAIVGFFPRHILVGCIGGIGVFLIVTGLCISTGLEDTNFAYNMGTMRYLFFDTWNLMMWIVPFALAALLRIATSTLKMSLRAEQLIFPGYFVMIPAIFYVVVLAAKLDLHSLRADGWLFDVGGDEGKWYAFYEYFDFGKIHWKCLWSTMPTQLALLFFNILHPPLNVPALAVSLDEDVDTNKELTAHGFSNLFAGFLGTVPNYLVYVNTLLFYRVGGVTRVAGFMLALATVVLLLVGTQPIAYLPVMEVGALIFVLGIDLVKEALWDTRHRASRYEYITIVSIMVCMTIWDFVIGVLFGIIASCVFFVVQNSQRRSIRSMEWGDTAMSTVRRPNTQRNYLREVSTQTIILRLQGFLFFGTINYVEDTIKQLSNTSSWQRNPLRFLVLDFSLVYGIDMSSAEAFVRIQRLLFSRGVTLVFCGFSGDSPVGRALAGVEVLGASGVELFSTFNDAIEWTENAYLRTWFKSQKDLTAFVLPGRQDAAIRHDEPINSFAASPRLSHMHNAGGRTMLMDVAPHAEVVLTTEEPFNTIYKTFSSYEDLDVNKLRPLKGYLKRKSLPAGHVLFRQNDPSDGLYLVQSGILRATYEFAPDPARSIVESMVPGTLAGELSALSGLPRNATVFVEQPAVVWWLSDAELRRMETQQPEMSRIFVRLVLKAAKIDTDILLSALASRQ